MTKCQRTENESNQSIPEDIIQHIHSFLNGKEAARTTILSKSWYTAWLTRPNLDFSNIDIPNISALLKFAKKTMQRYDESNRKIQSFKLVMDYYNSTVRELILEALKLGTIEISLTNRNSVILLSNEVLESDNLVRLSLRSFKIDLQGHKVNCSRLKYLNLSNVHVQSGSFRDMISMFPLIEELILFKCKFGMESGLGVHDFRKLKVLCLEQTEFGREEIKIRSDSLECVRLFNIDILMYEFDVPRIRKFKYFGPCLPSVSIKTTSSEWESEITFMLQSPALKFSWFLELRQLLLELSSSKIYLYLFTAPNWSPDFDIRDNVCMDKPPLVLETLRLEMIKMATTSSVAHAFLDGLFRCCRPSVVTLYWSSSQCMHREASNSFVKLLCETLVNESDEKRDMSGLDDLEEVNVVFFGEGRRPLPLMRLSDDSLYSATIDVKVCLTLRWGGKALKF